MPIHNSDFAKRLLTRVRDNMSSFGTSKRIVALLTGIIDEEPVQDYPLNYDLSYISASLKVQNPSKKEFMYAMNQLGYKAVQTYYSSKLWKTNAPPEQLYDIFKVYKNYTYKNDEAKVLANLASTTGGFRILKKPMLNPQLSFDVKNASEEMKPHVKEKQQKYYDNP